MVRFETNEQLVRALSVDLTPVHRLAPPSLRVLLWLAIVGAVALALAMVSDVGAMIQRLVGSTRHVACGDGLYAYGCACRGSRVPT